MKTFDELYMSLGDKLLKEGLPQEDVASVRAVYVDGTKAVTRSIEGVQFKITEDMGVPILHSKKMPMKAPLVELEWIWQEMSNDVRWLQDRGVKIWNSWQQKDGTIGKAYGYQMRNKLRQIPLENPNYVDCSVGLNQVEYLLDQLENNPSSRRMMTSLWAVDDLDEMALEPCVWATHWTLHGGKLNLHVKQRSADFALGLPFNVYQYRVLQEVVAWTLDIPLGDMHWNIDNLHIYERHVETFLDQKKNYVERDRGLEKQTKLVFPETFEKGQFFRNRLSEITLEDYWHLAAYKFEIAI